MEIRLSVGETVRNVVCKAGGSSCRPPLQGSMRLGENGALCVETLGRADVLDFSIEEAGVAPYPV